MMKKYLIFLLAAVLFCCASVSARADDTELNLMTIGNLFKWSYDSDDVMDILESYEDLSVEPREDSDTKIIAAEGETEDKLYFYYFYFDTDTDMLSEIECVDIYYDDEASMTAAAEVIEAYELDTVPSYENEFTLSYVEDLDGSMTVAGDKTICILGGKDASDEYYGYVSLVFINRAFAE